MIAAMAVAAGAAFADTTPITSANIVGFFTKAQKTTDDFKVISFQWATVDDAATKSIQDAIKPTMAGQAWVDPENDDYCIPGWNDNAPLIEIRNEIGGYAMAWYAKDGYDLDTDEVYPAWCDAEGYVLKNTKVPVGAGFWLWAPAENPNVFVTVKNPVK